MNTTSTRKIIATLMQLAITIVITGLVIGISHTIGRSPQSDYQTPPLAVAIHLLTVIPALLLGAFVNYARKGDALHRILGKVWALLLLITALDSFWIRDLTGHIGPIHILSVVTLVSLPLGFYHIRKGNVEAHKRAMRGAFIGLCSAALFALMPGRMLGNFLFG
ncbi:MAG: DUF2306 domain-containing protein [Novosphingobium sp.]